LLKAAVDASVEELRPWMPWAHAEPQPLDAKVDLLRRFRGHFDLGQDFVYGIFSADETAALGGTGLHPRAGDGALEIGYWIRSDRTQQGLATEAAGALTRTAFEVSGVSRVIVRVDPDNAASLAIPRKLGFAEEGLQRRVLHGPDGSPGARDAVVFALVQDDFPSSSAARVEVEAFDATGQRVL
jgi:RimJ/RimL family protein N-acetyltransferase